MTEGPDPALFGELARKQQDDLAEMRRRGAENERRHGGSWRYFLADLKHHRDCPDDCPNKADFAAGRRTHWWR